MNLTLFDVQTGDVAVAVSGTTDAVASTDPADTAVERTRPNVLLLVPVFVVLGVAAGFLVARRFDARAADREAVDVTVTPNAP